jgi:spermidine synthase
MEKNKLKINCKYEIILFVIEAICMTLELVASRVLSPFFGNSNIVWTSVIGIILLSSSLGNYYGGKLADSRDNEKALKKVIMLASIFVSIIPVVQSLLLDLISVTVKDVKLGAIISTIMLFFIPSLLLGLIIPIILKIKLDKIENTGKTSGRIYAISTMGGIFGTFLSGFVLIPNFGSVHILFVLSAILLVISLFVYTKMDKKILLYTITLIAIDVLLFTAYFATNKTNSQRVLNNELYIRTSIDTQYGRALIYNANYNGDLVRVLNLDSGFESATYIDKEKRNELVFEYTKAYNLMFKSENDINNVLLIGGAGYSYPKYYISHFDDKVIDVVEIDGEITNVAKKYFFLDELIKDYKTEENHRLNLYTEDGRTYLNNNTKKYDAILNDAFSGKNPAKTLTTLETVRKIKASLIDNGVYLTNVINSLEGSKSKFLRAEANTLKQVFKNVYVIPVKPEAGLEDEQNVMVIATDADIDFENTYDLQLKPNEIVITDDYCPVEYLTQD